MSGFKDQFLGGWDDSFEYLKSAPPFSILRDFLASLNRYRKKDKKGWLFRERRKAPHSFLKLIFLVSTC